MKVVALMSSLAVSRDGLQGPRFSAGELARRAEAVRAVMDELGLAALLLYGTAGAHAEVQYLTDWRVSREAVLLFPSAGEPLLLVEYFNHLPAARRAARGADVRWGGDDLMGAVGDALRERAGAARRVGIVGALPWQHFRALQSALPHVAFESATGALQRLRQVKSVEELAFLRHGAALTDLALVALEHGAHPGMNEFELAALIEGAYVPLGGGTHIHYLAATPMEQPEVCVPSQHLSARALRRGDVLITELSAHYHGYPGQVHRPFAIGAQPTDLYRRLYDVALLAYERIADVIRPGATTEAVLDAAECIHAAGFSIYDDLVHGFGGGYLPPVLRTRHTGSGDQEPFAFRENMTVVRQPNVITPDERAGLQLGQLVGVTADGVESLHGYPLQFVVTG